MELSKYNLSRRAVLMALLGGGSGAALIGKPTGGFGATPEPADRAQVTLYKNPDCGCCEGYADYLRENGFKVTAVPTNDLTVMGEKYGILDSLQPCHISLIG